MMAGPQAGKRHLAEQLAKAKSVIEAGRMRKKGVSSRDRQILEQRAKGKTIRAIANKMNISPNTVFLALKRLEPELKQALELAGYGLDKAVTKMAEMTDAKKTEFFSSDGIVTDQREVEDNSTRLAARREMLRIHGVGIPNTVNFVAPVVHVLTPEEKREAEDTVKRLIEYDKKLEAYDGEAENPLLAESVDENDEQIG